jgi:hypothetical protein
MKTFATALGLVSLCAMAAIVPDTPVGGAADGVHIDVTQPAPHRAVGWQAVNPATQVAGYGCAALLDACGEVPGAEASLR